MYVLKSSSILYAGATRQLRVQEDKKQRDRSSRRCKEMRWDKPAEELIERRCGKQPGTYAHAYRLAKAGAVSQYRFGNSVCFDVIWIEPPDVGDGEMTEPTRGYAQSLFLTGICGHSY